MIKKLSKNRTLRYSILEILIITIGIGIAVFFNNLNERKKLKKDVSSQLCEVTQEIDHTARLIRLNMDYTRDSMVAGLEALLQLTKSDSSTQKHFPNHLKYLTESEALNFQFPAIDEFLSQDYLAIINDADLSQLIALMNYYRNQVHFYDERLWDLQLNLVTPYIIKHMDFKSINIYEEPVSLYLREQDLVLLRSDKELRNIVAIYQNCLNESADNFESLIDILEKIKKEIASNKYACQN